MKGKNPFLCISTCNTVQEVSRPDFFNNERVLEELPYDLSGREQFINPHSGTFRQKFQPVFRNIVECLLKNNLKGFDNGDLVEGGGVLTLIYGRIELILWSYLTCPSCTSQSIHVHLPVDICVRCQLLEYHLPFKELSVNPILHQCITCPPYVQIYFIFLQRITNLVYYKCKTDIDMDILKIIG